MVRLKSKLLQSVPKLQCHSFSDSYITLALLNVRSLIAKLPDIEKDSNLKSATILCFCETWLNELLPSPVVQDNQIALRCDRASGVKGGIMISVTQDMQPSSTHTITSNDIEAFISILLLPNASHFQTVLYRSPSTSLQAFVSFLSPVLNHITMSGLPTIILGDFNKDILHCDDCQFVRLLARYGYTLSTVSNN